MASFLHRYNYDLNGNLHLLNPGNSGRLTPLRYDLRDRITRLGDVQYRLDEDGFLRQRGADIFEYNSKGNDKIPTLTLHVIIRLHRKAF